MPISNAASILCVLTGTVGGLQSCKLWSLPRGTGLGVHHHQSINISYVHTYRTSPLHTGTYPFPLTMNKITNAALGSHNSEQRCSIQEEPHQRQTRARLRSDLASSTSLLAIVTVNKLQSCPTTTMTTTRAFALKVRRKTMTIATKQDDDNNESQRPPGRRRKNGSLS